MLGCKHLLVVDIAEDNLWINTALATESTPPLAHRPPRPAVSLVRKPLNESNNGPGKALTSPQRDFF